MTAAVFLDRDGVINRAIMVDGRPHSPITVEALELIPGVVEACRQLADSGYPIVVITNQPEIARGRLRAADLDAMHDVLRRRLPLTDLQVCPHDDADGCRCRKPQPGMILDACERHSLDPTRSVVVGDRFKDIEAGHRAGCATVLVGDGYAERPLDIEPDQVADSLSDALPAILGLLQGLNPCRA